MPTKQFILNQDFTDSALVLRLHYRQVCASKPKSENTENIREERLAFVPCYFSLGDTRLKKRLPQEKLLQCLKGSLYFFISKPENCRSRNPRGNWTLSHSLETAVSFGNTNITSSFPSKSVFSLFVFTYK